jgi:hypothetical protein
VGKGCDVLGKRLVLLDIPKHCHRWSSPRTYYVNVSNHTLPIRLPQMVEVHVVEHNKSDIILIATA